MDARSIIKKWETLRLKAYADPASGGYPWTLAYGHTRGVRPGDTCTEAQAERWLDEDMAEAYSIVDAAVTVPLDYRQRDALCSFVFNVGPGAKNVKDGFVRLKNGQPSTLLRLLNAGDFLAAAGQFQRWTKASGKSMNGLVKRRGEERALFLTGTNVNPEPIPMEDNQMAPFLLAAIPSLIQALPEFAKIFTKPDVAERNVEAAVKASEIIMQATGTPNIQAAVEKVQADPEIAETANEALRMNRADLMDAFSKLNEIEQGNIKAAREFNAGEGLMVDTKWVKLKFIHILSLVFVIFSGVFVSVNWGSLTAELKGAVITLMVIAGWNGVRDYWMGSSSGSDRKTDLLRG